MAPIPETMRALQYQSDAKVEPGRHMSAPSAQGDGRVGADSSLIGRVRLFDLPSVLGETDRTSCSTRTAWR